MEISRKHLAETSRTLGQTDGLMADARVRKRAKQTPLRRLLRI